MHEAQLHEANCFITLTYDNKLLVKPRREFEDSPRRGPRAKKDKEGQHINRGHPENRTEMENPDSLNKKHAQLALKRLRKQLTKINPSTRIKYYLVGEYGDKTQRPHYHAIVFGEDFAADRYPIGKELYSSKTLEKAWGHGYVSIGELTFKSAAYVARYCMKKINGPMADEHYKRTNLTTGETYWITPEFALMSRGGKKGKGLAHGWFNKYGTDAYPHDFVIMNGHQHKPPRYYDQLYALLDKEGSVLMKLEREFTARSHKADNTPARLRARELVALAGATQLKRPLEK